MSLKKVGEVKKDKGFKIWDLAIYGAISAIVAVLFIAIFTTTDRSPLNGIKIYSENNLIFEYDFKQDIYKKYDDEFQGVTVAVIYENKDTLEINITTKSGYNTVQIAKSGSVKIKDADCSKFRKDCVYSPAITNNGGFIDCLPHGLQIKTDNFIPDPSIII